ncbi:hypothetical protein DXG03_002872 [Asterophora parasitica]|uniref:HSP90-domain-containing protein n=1 Tax=Asterophora parasitica TaxID=117018 RepID=A0A9P7G9V0_9AGAR|nr:hypothetical protein DXG03_002872 [Asterophora parasitica]
MSVPSFAPPPLPLGWSEHTAPGGQLYYFNAQTQESTYVRPIPAFAIMPVAQLEPPKKKEKPLVKTQIPGTDWLRVKTTEGNVFYSHKVKKQSIWTVPDEIKAAVENLEKDELKKRDRPIKIVSEEALEVQRIKEEVLVKRKAEDNVPLDEVVISKKARVEDEEEEEDESDESEEEDWQREAAAQLAAEAEEERVRKEEEAARLKEAEAQAKRTQLNMPERVDLSIEEAKALFKTLLREKDINPLHPWDTSLPQFISDPRYVLLPSVSARREAFDEYCRDRAREIRQSTVKKEKEVTNPKDAFERLLQNKVKSTRTSWTEFRRTWKKDRMFYGWGRDDREREKRFREFIKDLGETKRAMSQKAEADFFSLLREKGDVKDGAAWKDARYHFNSALNSIKRKLYDDPRYDAVGSSSLREELFNTFLKGNQQKAVSPPENADQKAEEEDQEMDGEEVERKRKEKKERAVKDREAKVRVERDRIQADIGRSRNDVNREEGERDFKSMLTDAIRDPQTTWDAALPQLKTDPRFRNSPLQPNHQLHLFHTHVEHLRFKHLKSLHALFEAHAPTLAVRFEELPLSSLLSSPPVVKLGYDGRTLQQDFDKWQRERTQESRKAFDEMLGENAFVEFWGRLGKIGGEGVDGGVKADEEDGEDGEGGGGKVDMKALAKNVDVGDMKTVLKVDLSFALIRQELTSGRTTSGISCLSTFQNSASGGSGLYSHQEIFIRELVSNANDALEKLRLTALTDKGAWNGEPLNITIKAVRDEDGKGGRIIITDTGIGMSPDELTINLGTLAKSGTSDFLAKAEGQSKDGTGNGNLIGAFGLGFYSSFLVADRVTVASIPPKSAKVPEPVQHVFSSSADDASFEIFPDPRGNILGRGTEITLFLKPDALEYLDADRIKDLIHKHSSFSSSFPVYLFTQRTEEVPDEDAAEEPATTAAAEDATETPADSDSAADAEEKPKVDEDEAVVEDVTEESEKKEPPPPKTKSVVVDEWLQLNGQPPIWTRDPKSISDGTISRKHILRFTDDGWTEEYQSFYSAFFKDFSDTKPLAWHHFAGDSGDGVSFKAILYLPGKIADEYWQQPLASKSKDIKLLVKRTFITSDLGDHALPKWASWVKVVIDADDLPLNVSRETLQSNRFLRQLKGIIIKRLIQVFTKIAEEDPVKFREIEAVYGPIFKIGAVEDLKLRDKLASLTRFTTTQRNETTLDAYLENKKKGQKQIFYLAEMGKKPEDLAQSVFVEKLHARGYEVLLLTEPLDEILFGNVRQWKNVPFQDVAKAGLKFGDEDQDPEDEKKEQKELAEKFKPLLEWLKTEAKDSVRDGVIKELVLTLFAVVISNRLVKSPCAIVAEAGGYTANVQKMMAASNAKGNKGGILHDYALKAKVLEINPRSPLIEGLLRRVEDLPTDEDEKDPETEEELREVASILIDGALVRSGFEVPNSNRYETSDISSMKAFFSRVDKVLRRSLGVSETAPTDETVKPAPPVDPELPSEEEQAEEQAPFAVEDADDDGKAKVVIPDHLKDKISIEMEEVDEDNNPIVHHDEL